MSAFEIEKEWVTKAGNSAVCAIINGTHRCGYVRVTENHPLYGVQYGEKSDRLIPFDEDKEKIGKRSILSLFIYANEEDKRMSPDVLFDVHGGITFSADETNFPINASGWWFGFDCAHAGDARILGDGLFSDGILRTKEYVIEQCESLAEQLNDPKKVIFED